MSEKFDPHKIAWGKPESPISTLCSYCFAKINEEDVPLRMWTADRHAAVFCTECEPQVLAHMGIRQR